MAYYKYGKFLTADQDAEFDLVYHPGTKTPVSGVYRCTGCGHSATSVKDHPLPTQNHHQHTPATVPILWQMIVKSHWR
jgi:hypothetical protein